LARIAGRRCAAYIAGRGLLAAWMSDAARHPGDGENGEAVSPEVLDFRFDTRPSAAELFTLGAKWTEAEIDQIYQHSLTHACAYLGGRLVGYVNVAWDGGVHAFLLDPTVHPDYRHRGIGTKLVGAMVGHLAGRGLDWLHVDYRPELEGFYRDCGFQPTTAGLIRL
jgi:ribosomal protein S18 acetylase RimI-like enzyme